MRPFILLLSILFINFVSCSAPKPELGIAGKNFPDAYYLKNGIVNKYYLHYKSKDGYDTSTNIQYREYKFNNANKLTINIYNPAMELEQSIEYSFSNDIMMVENNAVYFRGDTLYYEIIQPELINWSNNEAALYKSKIDYKQGLVRNISLEYVFLKDTVILNKNAKVFLSKQINRDSSVKNPKMEVAYNYRNIYMENIGLFSFNCEWDKGFTYLELIEQIPKKDFDKMAAHGIKRVAYIDPEKRMDKNSDFNICQKTEAIVDYYNADPDAAYIGGKKALWPTILPKIKKEKLHNESGYLTFRFVINCNGEIGWFVTEEAGLGYERKKFNAETVQHLFEIVSALTDCRPANIRGEDRDAYAYLTFKMKDGEIIELLP